MADMERLWTARELAAFVRYSESTITRMVSQCPEKLPPRISLLSRPRWLPETVYQWARQSSSTKAGIVRRGRPRAITR